MPDVTTLDGSLIDRLIAVLRGQGAPMVEHLNPGLSDDEMHALVGPLGITLPAEARQWWGYANGVPRGAPGGVWLSPSWWWAPLEEIVQECSDMRAIGSEGVLPGEPSGFKDEWLPIVIGDGMLVMDTSQSVVAPVYAVDFPDLGPDVSPTPDLPSLGALIQTWVRALEERAIWYDPDEQLFQIDMERLDALGIFTTFI